MEGEKIMSELTAKEYFNIKNRMTKRCQIKCSDCPLSINRNNKCCGCSSFESEYTAEAVAIVENWGKEHPLATNAEHYAEELRKIGYNADVEYIKKTCPVHKNAAFTKSRICNDANDCSECYKWWNEDYKGETNE